MRELIELMAAPFAACVVLVGIHAYLGLHVIQRKVIFVDLALAQIAALGATFGFLLGLSPHSQTAYVFSLAFAIIGAAIFAVTRMRHERIPQEAIIGITYAVALALAILVANRAPEGSEHIKETLTGTLLWVRWPTIFKTAGIYALVGLLHVALRKPFFEISFHPEEAYAQGLKVRFWDFIFYVTFAFVITSSVAIAGVLVVFSFLVIPAVIASLFASRISTRLLIGWSVGLVACAVGLASSYRFDLPSGPSVVAALGGALLLAGLIYSILAAPSRVGATLKAAAGIAAIVLILMALGVFFTSSTFLQIAHEHDWEAEHDEEFADTVGHGSLWEELSTGCGGETLCMAGNLQQARHSWERLSARLPEADTSERENWLEVLAQVDSPESRDLLAELAAVETEPLVRLGAAQLLVEEGDRRAVAIALELLAPTVPPLVRDEAYQLITRQAGEDFGFDPFGSEEANAEAIERIQSWAERP
jgi:zinc/manganese transport system permease protein